MNFNMDFVIESIPVMLKAVPVTLYIACLSMILGLILGFVLSLFRIYKIPVLGWLSEVFVTCIRAVPVIVQLYIAFYAIPLILASAFPNIDLGKLPSMLFAVTALTLNYSAYMSETIRSAILAVDKGQMEAAHSVGMSNITGMFRIVLPQAAVIALPNMGNLIIGIIKDTSLTYTVMVLEIMGTARKLAGQGYNFLEAYAIATCLYWVICIVIEKIFAKVEKRSGHFNNKLPLQNNQ